MFLAEGKSKISYDIAKSIYNWKLRWYKSFFKEGVLCTNISFDALPTWISCWPPSLDGAYLSCWPQIHPWASAVGDVLSPGTTANAASPAPPAEGIPQVVFKEEKKKRGKSWDFSFYPLNIVQTFCIEFCQCVTFEMCFLSVCTCIFVFHHHHPVLSFCNSYVPGVCGKLSSVMDQRLMDAWRRVCFPSQKSA